MLQGSATITPTPPTDLGGLALTPTLRLYIQNLVAENAQLRARLQEVTIITPLAELSLNEPTPTVPMMDEEVPEAPSMDEEVPEAPSMDEAPDAPPMDEIPEAPDMDSQEPQSATSKPLLVRENKENHENNELLEVQKKITFLLAEIEQAKEDQASELKAKTALKIYSDSLQENLNRETQAQRKIGDAIESFEQQKLQLVKDNDQEAASLKLLLASIIESQKPLEENLKFWQVKYESAPNETLLEYISQIKTELENIPNTRKELASKIKEKDEILEKNLHLLSEKISELKIKLENLSLSVKRCKKIRDVATQLTIATKTSASSEPTISLETLLKHQIINSILFRNLRGFILLKEHATLNEFEQFDAFPNQKVIAKFSEFAKKNKLFQDPRIMIAIACGFIKQQNGFCPNHLKPLDSILLDYSKRDLFKMLLEHTFRTCFTKHELQGFPTEFKHVLDFIEGMSKPRKGPALNSGKKPIQGGLNKTSKALPEEIAAAAQSQAHHFRQGIGQKRLLDQLKTVEDNVQTKFKKLFHIDVQEGDYSQQRSFFTSSQLPQLLCIPETSTSGSISPYSDSSLSNSPESPAELIFSKPLRLGKVKNLGKEKRKFIDRLKKSPTIQAIYATIK